MARARPPSAPVPPPPLAMFSTMEVAAKGLLVDPQWNWVFKNTFDAMEDQLNKVSRERGK